MSFKKTARRLGKCGGCRNFDKTNCVCKHKEMNIETVTAEAITPCGGQYYQPLDDYENAE